MIVESFMSNLWKWSFEQVKKLCNTCIMYKLLCIIKSPICYDCDNANILREFTECSAAGQAIIYVLDFTNLLR